MVARGATATPEEASTIATYLAAQFGSDCAWSGEVGTGSPTKTMRH